MKTNCFASIVHFAQKVALAVAGMAAISMPTVIITTPAPMMAQAPQVKSGTARTLQFEVASVKPNASGAAARIVRTPEGLTAINTEFTTLLEMAFQTRLLDLSGVPESLRSKRFDIVAKASGRLSGDEHWDMVQTLLLERFKLTFHRETKDAQVYALTLASSGSGNPGTRLGPKLSRSADPDCPANQDDSNFCGVISRLGTMTGQRVSMARIAREMSPIAGRPVQNETKLAGNFDFRLTWASDQSLSKVDSEKVDAGGIPPDPSSPSFFSAVKEQLGLKLESKKGQVEILVIDHAEQPSDN
jgi:uncharacterized protein (TIGR03435 family)